MRATRTKPTTRKTLMRAMHLDDAASFRALLDCHGWPEDEWSDYDLLVHAIRHNHRRVAHALLDKGARAKNGRPRVNSPLHLAASKKTAGWSRVIVRLLSRGASVVDKNYKGETALHVAFDNGAPDEVIDVLLRAHASRRMSDVFNKDLLGFVHVASTRSDSEMVRQLVEAHECLANCQVSLKSNSTYAGYTPLHFAVDHGRLEIAEFLLRHGADIYEQNANGSTALHLALELRNVEMIDIILSYDEYKNNRVNNSGVSHFMAACAGSNEDLVVSYLRSPLSTNALITSQIDNLGHHPLAGYTPLHFAAEFGRPRTVELLLSRGADCCVLTPRNVTPHLLAHQHHHQVIVGMLDRQCRTCQWFTELSGLVGARYHKVIGEDEEGNVAIRFEKKGDTDSSSDENSDGDGEGDDVARLSHDQLVSFFVGDGTSDGQCDSQTVGEFDYDFLEKFDNPQVRGETTGVGDVQFYRADVGLIGAGPKPAEELFGNGAKDFQQLPLDLSTTRLLPSYDAQNVSNAIDNQFSSSNEQTPVYASLQNVYHDQTIQVSSPSPTHSVQISWSPSISQNYFELTIESLNSDSAISLGNSFAYSSYYQDSGVANASQNDLTLVNGRESFYQADASYYVAPNADESFEQMDYSDFAPVASSTPNKVGSVVVERA